VVVISAELEAGWGSEAGREVVPRDVPATVAATVISPTAVARAGLTVGVGA
jgi:hypothetical protein